MLNFIDELNMNGIHFAWDLVSEQVAEFERELDETLHSLNQHLVVPLKHEDMEKDKLANALYLNCIYPRAISFEYFKENRMKDSVYRGIYEYMNLRQRIRLLKSFMQYREDDDRVRGYWIRNGCVTMRLGCREPNLLSLPKKVRACATPDEGKVIIKCDYSQIDLRILAELTQDEKLLELFNNGGDAHTNTAALLWNKPVSEVTEEERKAAKGVNYGIVYGVSVPGLQAELADVGLKVTLHQAAALRNRFMKVFAGVSEYQNRVCKAEKLVTLGGFEKSTEDMSVNQRLNWPVQTSCSEVFIASLEHLCAHKDANTKLIHAIHDEIWVETDAENTLNAQKCLLQSMEAGFKRYVHSLPFKGDVQVVEKEVGRNETDYD